MEKKKAVQKKNLKRLIFLVVLLLAMGIAAVTPVFCLESREGYGQGDEEYDQEAYNREELEDGENQEPVRTVAGRITLQKGEKKRLKAGAKKETVKWRSSDTKTASVSKTGLVTARKAGLIQIQAVTKTECLVFWVRVEQPKLSAKKLTLRQGEKKILFLLGNTRWVTWKSSSKAVAAVDAKGMVTAIAPGTCTITGKQGQKSYRCRVTVKKQTQKNRLIPMKRQKIKVGETRDLSSIFKEKIQSEDTVLWKSENPAVVRVSSKGKILGIRQGTSVVFAFSGKKTAVFVVEIKNSLTKK